MASVLADADFTPNPDRVIWINGEINKALENRLRPEILELTARSREPITVFIDSHGGSPSVGQRLLSLLRSSNQDGVPACRVITVAVSKACSAAADLLSAGDFAIATPGCLLMWHGTSFPVFHPVQAESAHLFAEASGALKQKDSVSLTRRSLPRFRFLVSASRSSFDHVRVDARNPGISDLKCFQELLSRQLSPGGQQVLKRAACNCPAYRGLLNCFQSRMRKVRRVRRIDLEKAMFNASAAFEFRTAGKRRNWSLSSGGLRRLTECYLFLQELLGNANGDELSRLCRMSPKNCEQDDFNFLPFFLAVGGALQEGENKLTATDAFWLGLVDTVR